MRALDTGTLKGLWSAVPTPWDERGNVDQGMLTRNCQRLAAARVDGIYTTDSDGEFYAIELDQFRQLARSFAAAMEGLPVDVAMGVTWTHTQGIIDRIKVSCDVGIPNVHVAFPFFMPLAASDVDRFWEAPGERTCEWPLSRRLTFPISAGKSKPTSIDSAPRSIRT